MSARRGDPEQQPEQPDEGGMVPLAEFEAVESARVAAHAALQASRTEPAIPEVEGDRLRELKAQARREIELRLATRRRQRRLMRGAEQERRS